MKKQTTDEKTWSETLVEVLEKRGYDKAISDVEKMIDKLEWIGKVRLKAEIAKLKESK